MSATERNATTSVADDGAYLIVSFWKTTGKVDEVMCYSERVLQSDCAAVAGVHIGDTESSVKRRLGAPSAEFIDAPSKDLFYQSLNVKFTLAKQRVYSISIGHWAPLQKPPS